MTTVQKRPARNLYYPLQNKRHRLAIVIPTVPHVIASAAKHSRRNYKTGTSRIG
jgi:hypothetical protein